MGPIVDKKYFYTSCMDNDERIKFEEWHESKRDKEYNFENEVKTCCCNDVKILRFCCIKFYSCCKTMCVVEPFFNGSLITTGSMAMRIFGSLFMKQNVIGVIPKAGCKNDVNQGVIGMMWLEQLNKKIENFRWRLSADGEI